MNWFVCGSYWRPLLPDASVGSGSVVDENVEQLTDWNVVPVTAGRTVMNAPWASRTWNLSGYVRPTLPVFTTGGLSTGAKKPVKFIGATKVWETGARRLP